MNFMEHIEEPVKVTGDSVSLLLVAATLAEWLPSLAALAALIWTSLRIWEVLRVKGWWKRRDE